MWGLQVLEDLITVATCSNAAGSFTCSCKVGFEGDGVSCVAATMPVGLPELVLSGTMKADGSYAGFVMVNVSGDGSYLNFTSHGKLPECTDSVTGPPWLQRLISTTSRLAVIACRFWPHPWDLDAACDKDSCFLFVPVCLLFTVIWSSNVRAATVKRFPACSQRGSSDVVSTNVVITASPTILLALELAGSGNITAAMFEGLAVDVAAFLGLDPLLVELSEPLRRRALLASQLTATIYPQDVSQAVDFQDLLSSAALDDLLPSTSGWENIAVTSVAVSADPPLVSPAALALAAAQNSTFPPRCFNGSAPIASKLLSSCVVLLRCELCEEY